MIITNNRLVCYMASFLFVLIGLIIFISSIISISAGGIIGGIFMTLIGLTGIFMAWYFMGGGDIVCCGKTLFHRNTTSTGEQVV